MFKSCQGHILESGTAANAADCKSVTMIHRRFESYLSNSYSSNLHNARHDEYKIVLVMSIICYQNQLLPKDIHLDNAEIVFT